MIIRERPGGLILIRQTEHARLCGEMARAWGNERCAQPAPLESVALAAAEHDNGWKEWEDAPRLNPEARRPYHYGDIPIDQHRPLYRRGIARVVEMDRYAGLLVSLHCYRLYASFRRGQPGADEMLAEQRLLQGRLREELRDDHEAAPHLSELALAVNNDLLFAWDTLSLFLCHGRAWRSEIDVPADYSGRRLSLRVAVEDDRWRLEPFPFSAPLSFEIAALEITPAELRDEMALRRALEAGEEMTLSVRIAPGPEG